MRGIEVGTVGKIDEEAEASLDPPSKFGIRIATFKIFGLVVKSGLRTALSSVEVSSVQAASAMLVLFALLGCASAQSSADDPRQFADAQTCKPDQHDCLVGRYIFQDARAECGASCVENSTLILLRQFDLQRLDGAVTDTFPLAACALLFLDFEHDLSVEGMFLLEYYFGFPHITLDHPVRDTGSNIALCFGISPRY